MRRLLAAAAVPRRRLRAQLHAAAHAASRRRDAGRADRRGEGLVEGLQRPGARQADRRRVRVQPHPGYRGGQGGRRAGPPGHQRLPATADAGRGGRRLAHAAVERDESAGSGRSLLRLPGEPPGLLGAGPLGPHPQRGRGFRGGPPGGLLVARRGAAGARRAGGAGVLPAARARRAARHHAPHGDLARGVLRASRQALRRRHHLGAGPSPGGDGARERAGAGAGPRGRDRPRRGHARLPYRRDAQCALRLRRAARQGRGRDSRAARRARGAAVGSPQPPAGHPGGGAGPSRGPGARRFRAGRVVPDDRAHRHLRRREPRRRRPLQGAGAGVDLRGRADPAALQFRAHGGAGRPRLRPASAWRPRPTGTS